MFGLLKKKWPEDEYSLVFFGSSLLAATVAAACHFRSIFECDKLEMRLADHTRQTLLFPPGSTFGGLLEDFCPYSPLHFWTLGLEIYKPDGKEQLLRFLAQIAGAYSHLLQIPEFTDPLMKTFNLTPLDVGPIFQASMLPAMLRDSMQTYMNCDLSDLEVSAADVSEFSLKPAHAGKLTCRDSFHLCEYKVKCTLQFLHLKPGMELRSLDVVPYTFRFLCYLDRVLKVVLSGELERMLNLAPKITAAELFRVLFPRVKEIGDQAASRWPSPPPKRPR